LNLVSSGDNLLNLTPSASANAAVINSNGYIKFNASAVSYIRGFSTATAFAVYNSAFTNIFNIGTTAACYVNTGSNFLIGTTTDAGYKLDVNGTARLNGSTTFGTLGAGTGMFWDNVNNRLGVGIASPAYGIDIAGAIGAASSIRTGWGVYSRYLINPTATGTYIEFQPSVHQMQFTINGTEAIRIPSTRNVLIGTTTDAASSKLTVESTTQGFLPPRMTTTQKNAIATPASGLVVYDTTLGKLCVRGAAAWETITSI
jgi:hypothetical protein